MAPKVERITDSFELGEGPHWDAGTQSLYFVDVFGKAINRYVPATKKHTRTVIGANYVSIVIPVEGQKNKFVISLGRQLCTVNWDGVSDKFTNLEKIDEVENEPSILDNRLNDGKCDRTGRLWIGTMGGPFTNTRVELNRGNIYSIDSSKKFKHHESGIHISNGFAWSADNTKLYYVDSLRYRVDEYDYDIKTGTLLSAAKPIFTLEKHGIAGFPDGMAIDTDGNLWVAVFNGYQVIKIDPRRPETLLQTIKIPAKQVTSVTFGGPNLDELYVTSSRVPVDGVEFEQPEHGATYRVTGIGAKGFDGQKFKL